MPGWNLRFRGHILPSWLIATVFLTLLLAYAFFITLLQPSPIQRHYRLTQNELDHADFHDSDLILSNSSSGLSKEVLEESPKSRKLPKGELNDGFDCPKKYGKIDVFVAVVTESYKNFYGVAQATLRCYLQSHDYRLRLIDLNTDERVKKHCSHTQLFFRKHCAASVYLEDADWLMVLDADAGVVNPGHCLEEYINNDVDIIFYERFFNWEVAAGNYFVKNTPFSKKFLRRWADYQYEQPKNWNGADNGVLQLLLLQTLLPNNKPEIDMCTKVWLNGSGYDTYMRFVMCCKVALGSRRIWNHIKIYRRAHGWVHDWYMSNDKWCQSSFMLHGWKSNTIGTGGWDSPFTRIMNGSDCDAHHPWPWREERHVSCEEMKKMFKDSERSHAKGFPAVAKGLPFLEEADIGECWPNCKH